MSTKKTGTVEFAGQTYTIPNADDWPLTVLESIEEGQVIAAVKALLGEQWSTFKAQGHTVGDLKAFFEKVQAAAGIEGN